MLALVEHDHMEQDRKDSYQAYAQGAYAEKDKKIAAHAMLAQKVIHLLGDEFHAKTVNVKVNDAQAG